MGLFLWWAAERGLTADHHDPIAAAQNPTKHIIEQCDTKLWSDDFNREGNAFVEAAYIDYLHEVSAYAKHLGVGDYDIPEEESTTLHFFDWLDARLATWRQAN